MFKFKVADPTRRMPVYLQAHTKENLVWQLKLTAVIVGALFVKGVLDERRAKKEQESE